MSSCSASMRLSTAVISEGVRVLRDMILPTLPMSSRRTRSQSDRARAARLIFS